MTAPLAQGAPAPLLMRLLPLGALVMLLVLGWITWQALSLEERERRAQDDARTQERTRGALWRMDSLLTPIIASEAGRPYFEYQPFFPAERAYTAMLRETSPQDVLIASPLLTLDAPLIRLHYQRAPGDTDVTSPQAPAPPWRTLAETAYLTPYALELREARLAQLRQILRAPSDAFAAAIPEVAAADAAPSQAPTAEALPPGSAAADATDYAARQQVAAEAQRNTIDAQRGQLEKRALSAPASAPAPALSPSSAPESARASGEASEPEPLAPAGSGSGAADASEQALADSGAAMELRRAVQDRSSEPDVQVSSVTISRDLPVQVTPFRARWIPTEAGEHELVLEREVVVGESTLVQGVWLDWPLLRRTLLAQLAGDFAGASLTPVAQLPSTLPPSEQSSLLAAIPARLTLPPGKSLPPPAFWTPLRGALLASWALALGSLTALVLAARSASELAERRGRFVSAVTHELRTPLTTFRLYSQMLAEGMAPDEASRRDYARTLERESLRLSSIVESVLEYARLSSRAEPASAAEHVPELLERVLPSLRHAATAGGRDLRVLTEPRELEGLRVRADAPRVQQVLVNLVDNACRHALPASEPAIDVSAVHEGTRLVISVRDHGPGVPQSERRRIFRPFERGRARQDGSVPGLGLGLALSRELAQRMGGDLTCRDAHPGACFRLELPVAEGA